MRIQISSRYPLEGSWKGKATRSESTLHIFHAPPEDQSAIPKLTTSIATSSPSVRGPRVSNLTTGLSGLGSKHYSIAALI